jgi:hypothetical protein
MDQALINEDNCPFEYQGKTYSAQGAYVDPNVAMVYVKTNPEQPLTVKITDWHGKHLGDGKVTSVWKQQNIRTSYTMVAVKFQIGIWWFSGRYSPDYGELCKARRVKRGL